MKGGLIRKLATVVFGLLAIVAFTTTNVGCAGKRCGGCDKPCAKKCPPGCNCPDCKKKQAEKPAEAKKEEPKKEEPKKP